MSVTVAAHPPCERWGRYWSGGPSAKVRRTKGDDGGCFAAALAAVRRWGGVLEHPAGSNAWKAHGLRAPTDGIGWHLSDIPQPMGTGVGEFTCEVWQSVYGHRARKRTWLLFVPGHPINPIEGPHALDWTRRPGTHQVGWFDRIKPTLSKKAASATTPAFRDILLSIARSAVRGPQERGGDRG